MRGGGNGQAYSDAVPHRPDDPVIVTDHQWKQIPFRTGTFKSSRQFRRFRAAAAEPRKIDLSPGRLEPAAPSTCSPLIRHPGGPAGSRRLRSQDDLVPGADDLLAGKAQGGSVGSLANELPKPPDVVEPYEATP